MEMLWYYGDVVAVFMWSPVGLMWNFPWHCCGIAVKLQGDYRDILIMVLLWDCFGIAVILLWDSCDCNGIAVGVLMYCWGVDVEFLWDWWSFLCHCWGLLYIATILLWSCCMISVVFLGNCWGITVILLWHCCDIAAGFLWHCFENPGIAAVAQLLWESIAELVRTFHRFSALPVPC